MGMRIGLVFRDSTRESCRDICGRYPTCKGFALRMSKLQGTSTAARNVPMKWDTSVDGYNYDECIILSGSKEELAALPTGHSRFVYQYFSMQDCPMEVHQLSIGTTSYGVFTNGDYVVSVIKFPAWGRGTRTQGARRLGRGGS